MEKTTNNLVNQTLRGGEAALWLTNEQVKIRIKAYFRYHQRDTQNLVFLAHILVMDLDFTVAQAASVLSIAQNTVRRYVDFADTLLTNLPKKSNPKRDKIKDFLIWNTRYLTI